MRTDANRGPADPRDSAALHSKIRRSAWVLGVLAVIFYLGFIAWNFYRGLSAG